MKIKLIKLSNLRHFVLNGSDHRQTKQKIFRSICISSILLAFPSSKNVMKKIKPLHGYQQFLYSLSYFHLLKGISKSISITNQQEE